MDRNAIERLLNPTKAEAKPANATIRNSEGKLEKVSLTPAEVGYYAGKLGSIRRSRKGQPRRQANGWVKYHPNWEIEVISYKL